MADRTALYFLFDFLLGGLWVGLLLFGLLPGEVLFDFVNHVASVEEIHGLTFKVIHD